jgi:hypothetical protein
MNDGELVLICEIRVQGMQIRNNKKEDRFLFIQANELVNGYYS